MARPTDLPVWANTEVTDPTSGQLNKAEPTGGEKATGFVPHNMKPPRGHINWLFWHLSEWVTYLDGLVDQVVDSGSSPVFNAPVITAAKMGTIEGQTAVTDTVLVISPLTVTGKATLAAATNSIAGSNTGITGAELEVLSGGVASNADALHTHSGLDAYAYCWQGAISGFLTGGNVEQVVPLGVTGPNKNFTIGTNTLTVEKDGVYEVHIRIHAGFISADGGGAYTYLILKKNGTDDLLYASSLASGMTDLGGSPILSNALVSLVAGDTLQLKCAYSGSANIATMNNPAIIIKKIGA